MTNTAEIEKLIQSGENESLEFKSNFNNELIETLVAFANTSGGKIIAGINPKGEFTGISVNP
jgi:ATP-dependent DNA helicase RecG